MFLVIDMLHVISTQLGEEMIYYWMENKKKEKKTIQDLISVLATLKKEK